MNRYTIRGATTVESNTYEEIKTKTIELLKDVLEKNKLEIDDIESIIFTCT
jgi:chorismate mutase